MIKNHDRSGWIGASDTEMVIGRWDTESFRQWWAVKLGYTTNNFTNKAMLCGTHYEHNILRALGVRKMDRQIKIRKLRLRVNLDGETRNTIIEVKTAKNPPVTPPEKYVHQVWVQEFAAGKSAEIATYRVTEEEYDNYFLLIDPERLTLTPIPYNAEWINTVYLPRLRYLAKCMKKKIFPSEEEWRKDHQHDCTA